MVAHWARVVVSVAAVGFSLSACSHEQAASQSANGAAVAAAAPQGAAAPINLAGSLPDFTSLVDRYGPAVVNVTVVEKSQPVNDQGAGGPPGMSPNDPFYELYGDRRASCRERV